jgi:hypothetical protein
VTEPPPTRSPNAVRGSFTRVVPRRTPLSATPNIHGKSTGVFTAVNRESVTRENFQTEHQVFKCRQSSEIFDLDGRFLGRPYFNLASRVSPGYYHNRVQKTAYHLQLAGPIAFVSTITAITKSKLNRSVTSSLGWLYLCDQKMKMTHLLKP